MKNIISVCWTEIGLCGINQRVQPIETHVDRFRSPLPSPTISITSYLFMMESDTRGCPEQCNYASSAPVQSVSYGTKGTGA